MIALYHPAKTIISFGIGGIQILDILFDDKRFYVS